MNESKYHNEILKKYLIGIILICISFSVFGITKSANDLNYEEEKKVFPVASTNDPQIIVYFFYNPGCPICIDKQVIMLQFNDSHPSIEYIEKKVYYGVSEDDAFSEAFFSTYPEDIIGIPNPSVVFTIEASCRYLLLKDYITTENLELVFTTLMDNPSSCQGWITFGEFNPWIAFVTGIISGISPCIILMTGVLGSSFFSSMDNKKFILGMLGFIIGVLVAYLSIGVLFAFLYDFSSIFFSSLLLKLMVGIPLLVLGVWMSVDAFNENSKLFKTPENMKKFFKTLAEKGTIISTLLLGLAFTLVKSPCIASIMLSLLFKISSLGSNISLIVSSIVLFCLGVILPILIIFGIMKWGISSEKINRKRMKLRPYLRLLTGILIIILTLWSLI